MTFFLQWNREMRTVFTMLFCIQFKHIVTSGLHDWFSPAFHMIGAKFGATRLLRVSKLILIFGRTIALINEKTAFYVDLRH